MLRENFLKEKLETGNAVIGTWANVPSVIVADIIASTGLDFIIIDSEHGPISFETAQEMVIACESRNVSPVMRVGGIIEADILRALDIGIHCLQVPNVTGNAEVKRLIGLAKYPPAGRRGFSPFTRAGNYSLEHARELTSLANKNVLLAVHVEGKEAMDNIEEITAIKGIDIIFIGIFDISKSLGIPGDVGNPKVVNVLKMLTKRVNDAGKYPGTIVNSIEQMNKFLDSGLKYIAYSVDCEVISSSYKKVVSDFRKIGKAWRRK